MYQNLNENVITMCFHKGPPVSRYVSHVNVIFQSLSHKFLYRVTQNLFSFHHLMISFRN